MPEPWLPTDPRQREIHRLLLLVGGEPAAFFIDAARLMDGDYHLEATTHVVAHLLRELDGSLRAVLRPMVGDDDWPEPGDDRQRRIIDAICDALGIDSDDPFRELWREYAPRLHKLAHKFSRAAPRPMDDDFRELWAQGQVVIQQLARRIEANYTRALPLVDELAAGAPDVARLREEVPHSTVVLDRFFERAGVAWLEPLRGEGYFSNPPPLVYEEDGSVGYARWPQARYLTRIAAEAPDAVIDIGLALETDSPEAHEALVDAALALEPEQSVRLRPKVEEWLATPVQWQLPFKAQALVAHLVAGGRVDEGLALLRALLAAERTQRDAYLAAKITRELTEQIFPAAGTAGLALLADLLDAAVAEQSESGHDYSYIWRPFLNGERRRDFRDALVSALRDASASAVDGQPERLGEVVALLEGHERSIFRRLVLDLLVRHPDPELIASRLTNRDLLLDLNAEREYDALAQAHFAVLGGPAKQQILDYIDAGPERGADDADFVGRWRLHTLRRFPEPLSAVWQERVDELAAQYTEAEPEALPESGFIGPSSPLGRDEVAAMSVEEIVVFLREWRPPEDGWRTPDREGLGRLLRQLVAEDPQRFAEAAAAFADVDPTYVHALIGGLREALTNRRPFPWPAVLELAVATLDRPRLIDGRDPSGLSGEDPGWAWAWQDLAHLIGAGLGGDNGIPREERERVWQVIARITQDEHPSVDDEREEGAGRQRPMLLAVSSVRGAALEAAMSYVWWLKEDLPAAERHMPEEARELLEQRLDTDVERTIAVHSLFGKWFPFLATADPTWTAGHLEQIFPPGSERRRAAFHSYLALNNVWERVFPLLVDEYRHGIEEFADEVAEAEPLLGDVGLALINHLMTAFRYGLVDLSDGSGLLERFYELASLERRAEAIESVGYRLIDEDDAELTPEMAERLRRLWEQRLAAVLASGEDGAGEELRGFAWWFASGKLDPAWSLAQLEASIVAGGRVHPDHLVAERLAALRSQHLPAVLRTLELLIESGTRPWFVIGARDEIEAILVTGLAANGEPAEHARDIVNRLVARGHVDYERLLQR